jgi:hypothetical protein
VTQGFEIWEADRLDCRLVPYDWPFDADLGGVIAEHWRRETRRNPKIYDGVIFLSQRPRRVVEASGERVLQIDFFEARFSRFLAWRDFGFPGDEVFNSFSMPAVRSSDGAFLLGEMGVGHSTPGRIYFPAGTPDRDDLAGDVVDLTGSLIRELDEETGLRISERHLRPGWRVVFFGAQVACLRIVDWPEPAAAIEAAAERHIRADPAPELARVHMVSRRAQLANPSISAFVAGFLEHVLPE